MTYPWERKNKMDLAFLGMEMERPVSSMEMVALEVTIDSGAAENVLSEECVPSVKTTPSEGSRARMNFLAANGDKIPNQGEKKLRVVTQEGLERSMLFQVAPVTKPLGSVSKICKKGHRVVFDDDGSYIENKITGEYMNLREKNGVYVLDVWLNNADAWGFPRQGR